jgi:hypothetical protein
LEPVKQMAGLGAMTEKFRRCVNLSTPMTHRGADSGEVKHCFS